VTVDGQPVRAGETVTLAIGAANRDPARFPDPDTLDLGRRATGHLAFGHGAHQCLGQHLARLQLAESLTALVRRVPSLALAVPVDQVRGLMNMTVYGVDELPVRWQEILPRSSNGSDPR
jgi:cytochrome P450